MNSTPIPLFKTARQQLMYCLRPLVEYTEVKQLLCRLSIHHLTSLTHSYTASSKNKQSRLTPGLARNGLTVQQFAVQPKIRDVSLNILGYKELV